MDAMEIIIYVLISLVAIVSILIIVELIIDHVKEHKEKTNKKEEIVNKENEKEIVEINEEEIN